MRIVPNDQDTGGFFVAVFEKVAELDEGRKRQEGQQPAENEDEKDLETPGEAGMEEKPKPAQKPTRWQQRGKKDDDDETGVEGLEPFATHPTFSKQWNMIRSCFKCYLLAIP